jgi:hypothetical protein
MWSLGVLLFQLVFGESPFLETAKKPSEYFNEPARRALRQEVKSRSATSFWAVQTARGVLTPEMTARPDYAAAATLINHLLLWDPALRPSTAEILDSDAMVAVKQRPELFASTQHRLNQLLTARDSKISGDLAAGMDLVLELLRSPDKNVDGFWWRVAMASVLRIGDGEAEAAAASFAPQSGAAAATMESSSGAHQHPPVAPGPSYTGQQEHAAAAAEAELARARGTALALAGIHGPSYAGEGEHAATVPLAADSAAAASAFSSSSSSVAAVASASGSLTVDHRFGKTAYAATEPSSSSSSASSWSAVGKAAGMDASAAIVPPFPSPAAAHLAKAAPAGRLATSAWRAPAGQALPSFALEAAPNCLGAVALAVSTRYVLATILTLVHSHPEWDMVAKLENPKNSRLTVAPCQRGQAAALFANGPALSKHIAKHASLQLGVHDFVVPWSSACKVVKMHAVPKAGTALRSPDSAAVMHAADDASTVQARSAAESAASASSSTSLAQSVAAAADDLVSLRELASVVSFSPVGENLSSSWGLASTLLARIHTAHEEFGAEAQTYRDTNLPAVSAHFQSNFNLDVGVLPASSNSSSSRAAAAVAADPGVYNPVTGHDVRAELQPATRGSVAVCAAPATDPAGPIGVAEKPTTHELREPAAGDACSTAHEPGRRGCTIDRASNQALAVLGSASDACESDTESDNGSCISQVSLPLSRQQQSSLTGLASASSHDRQAYTAYTTPDTGATLVPGKRLDCATASPMR